MAADIVNNNNNINNIGDICAISVIFEMILYCILMRRTISVLEIYR